MLSILALLLMATSADAAASQKLIDQLIARCGAGRDIRLVAQSKTDVLIFMLNMGRSTTPAEDRRVNCVFDRLKSMPDLNLGFLGNAEKPATDPSDENDS